MTSSLNFSLWEFPYKVELSNIHPFQCWTMWHRSYFSLWLFPLKMCSLSFLFSPLLLHLLRFSQYHLCHFISVADGVLVSWCNVDIGFKHSFRLRSPVSLCSYVPLWFSTVSPFSNSLLNNLTAKLDWLLSHLLSPFWTGATGFHRLLSDNNSRAKAGWPKNRDDLFKKTYYTRREPVYLISTSAKVSSSVWTISKKFSKIQLFYQAGHCLLVWKLPDSYQHLFLFPGSLHIVHCTHCTHWTLFIEHKSVM